MDPIRTLLLARTHTVVLDPDRVASAATRPTRADDIDRFEDELIQLGFVMSLDLAMALRRLPRPAIEELRRWVIDTLGRTLEARPRVPPAPYVRRVRGWLTARAEQPCPWCARVTQLGALDPCGHLVCRSCWSGGAFAGCPICHRRVAPGEPFVRLDPAGERVTEHAGGLALVHLGLDVIGAARARFERLLAQTAPLAPADRDEIELVIDTTGPRAIGWLPARIPVEATLAVALARLWMIAPDRSAVVAATAAHVPSATCVLRIAVVLMGGNPELAEPIRLRSLSRSLRRAVLAALEQLPADHVIEDMGRHARLWQRVGERLHPFEHAERLPTATLGFAAIRGTQLATASFGPALRAKFAIAGDRVDVTPWGAEVEARLRAGDPVGAAARLGQRPAELLRRIDHLLRLAAPDAVGQLLEAIAAAVPRGAPAQLLRLVAHLARRAPVLGADTVAAIIRAILGELVGRAAALRNFARAILDRDLAADIWELACVHAAGRANMVYVRARDGSIATYRRRDHEPALARLGRLLAGDHDGVVDTIPPADAPTWFALVRDDIALPTGSAGYLPGNAADLVGELAVR